MALPKSSYPCGMHNLNPSIHMQWSFAPVHYVSSITNLLKFFGYTALFYVFMVYVCITLYLPAELCQTCLSTLSLSIFSSLKALLV